MRGRHAAPAAQPAGTVLALVRGTGGSYDGALLGGLNREVAAAGGRVVVVQTPDPGDRPDEIDRIPDFDLPLGWDVVDGAVAVSVAAGGGLLSRLRATGVPVVLASSRVPGFAAPIALPNNHGGTVAAVEHLISHGHRRIGFVGSAHQTDMVERHEAYAGTLAAHGLPGGPDLLFRAADTTETGGSGAAAAVAAAIAAGDGPTALVVATDRNAIGLMTALEAVGIEVPRDVAVLAFDNIEAAAFSTPTLSSVDQPYDEVGALAGRLVVAALEGRAVAAGPYTAQSAVVVARESCGCSTDPSGGGRAVRATPQPPGALREEILSLLRDTLVAQQPDDRTGPDRGQSFLDAAARDVEALLRSAADATPDQVQRLVATLQRLAPRPDVLHHLATALQEIVRRPAPAVDGDPSPAASLLTTALWRMQAGAYLRRSQTLEAELQQQFDVDAALLDARTGDPRLLGWLARTNVRAASLALWRGDGSLEVVGSYNAHGPAVDGVGDVLAVPAFPSRALVDQVDAVGHEVCFVVPVRTVERDWGVLALVAEVGTTSARDTYRHWAALLCGALENEELQTSVRVSEERYALAARASNDGLWEVDVTSGRLYTSARCRELLGLPDGDPTGESWEEAIHPDDRAGVRAGHDRALAAPGTPVELEYRLRRADGSWHWMLCRELGVTDASGRATRLVGSLADIHQRKELEERLRLGALLDPLTGLANRNLFLDRLVVAVETLRRRPRATYAVVFLDLDGFKLVNDSLGHLVGDELLEIVAERIRSELRTVDTAARFGGDEFAILLTDPVPDEVLVIARRVQDRIAEPVVLAGQELSITASAGIATSASGYTDPEDVLRDADIAMYEAKAAARGSASLFDPEMHARASGRLTTRGELRTALTEQQFVVHYQPIVTLDGGPLVHFEALVRWQHPVRGLLMPGAFLPAMEEDASIVALGRWLLDEVCRQVAQWRSVTRDAVVSVNISHHEFWSDGLAGAVAAALERHGLGPEHLVLEITESVIMDDLDRARGVMAQLHGLGVQLQVDDFGTGQSSLHALRSFPVHALKIDGSFIRELGTVEETTALVEIIIEIGRVLSLDVIAECVETPEQAALLTAMGCRTVQGWLYSRAVPSADAGRLLGTVVRPTASILAPADERPTDDLRASGRRPALADLREP